MSVFHAYAQALEQSHAHLSEQYFNYQKSNQSDDAHSSFSKTHSFTKKIFGLAALTLAAFAISACGGEKEASNAASGSDGAAKGAESKVITVAHTNYYIPYNYVNDKGESDGFEVQVIKEVAKLLPDYEFKFVPTTDDDLLLGVQQGKYDFGTKGIWITEARKQKYLFTNEYLGASEVGAVIRSEDKDKIKSIDDLAAVHAKLVPIAPQDARYMVVDSYNKAHPNAKIDLKPSDTFAVTDAYTYLLEKRFDAYVEPSLSFISNTQKDASPYAKFKDRLSFVSFYAIPIYPIVNKNRGDLIPLLDDAIKQLKANGTIQKLEHQYLGEELSKKIAKQ